VPVFFFRIGKSLTDFDEASQEVAVLFLGLVGFILVCIAPVQSFFT
jgi:hypothetical protein